MQVSTLIILRTQGHAIEGRVMHNSILTAYS